MVTTKKKEEEAKELIKKHEGLKLKPYLCTAGKLTIGYGRNLDALGISKEEAEMMFENDFKRALENVQNKISFFNELHVDARYVLVNMAFNLGITGLLGFKKTLNHLEQKNYPGAAKEMLDSKWATQVGRRATELADIIRNLS